ncbi:helix-turn-helix domain-containing protein [Streptomyces sp. H27-D2]|uniref:helix-turn-helix domain-containing protein n=1 Tax=Streptomyces sp. H27-D2 TaxID=3046304 RepID=UPI002DB8078D|nr:helix-turn-helix transcriptional regulator [Streptomyces sp. H27-D2]MEC4017305.1 helix-turn-helix transcriptional regulator [Streptomyces sp. H27-D2]
MPPSKLPPSARQRRLGAELRRLREHAGLSATGASALLGATQSRVSNIEAGRYAVSADRVRSIAHSYTCTDQALIDALAGMSGGRTRGWWEEYREILPSGALDLAEIEHHAASMHITSVIHMPGLLQTGEHARAVISDAVPPLAPPDVEHRVSHRIKRQAVLYRDDPTPLTAIVHEAALRMGFGGRTVARAQLEHLIEMGERKHISVLVIPFGAGTFPGSGQSTVYFCGPVAQLDTVQLDTDHGSEFLDAPAQLVKYRTVLDRMEKSALNPAKSRALIRRIAQDN